MDSYRRDRDQGCHTGAGRGIPQTSVKLYFSESGGHSCEETQSQFGIPQQREMTTYSAWNEATEERLRGEGDDVFHRPLLSLVDDEKGIEPDHSNCNICQRMDNGHRWVPDNGGAWVIPMVWEQCKRDPEKYEKRLYNRG